MSDHTPNSPFVQLSFDDAEHWKEIPGYEGLYAVSDQGRVISTHRKKPHILVIRIARNGYPYVILSKNRAIINERVHRLVMLAFRGICPEKQTVNHIDGIKTNNQLSNLEYLSQRDNNLHSYRHLPRKVAHGSEKPQAKLSEDDVHRIKQLLQIGALTNKQIGQLFGVGPTIISDIKNRKKWRHTD